MEPAFKRQRVLGPVRLDRAYHQGHTSSDLEDDELNDDSLENFEVIDERPLDPDEELKLKQARIDKKLKTTFEAIFAKYGKSFDGVGDEIDLWTGEIVVNNGHLHMMEYEGVSGKDLNSQGFGDVFNGEGAHKAVGGDDDDTAVVSGGSDADIFMLEDNIIHSDNTSGSIQQMSDQGKLNSFSMEYEDNMKEGMMVLPSDTEIIAQFGPKLGPRIANLIAQQKFSDDSLIEPVWQVPSIPAFQAPTSMFSNDAISSSYLPRSISPIGDTGARYLPGQPSATAENQASSAKRSMAAGITMVADSPSDNYTKTTPAHITPRHSSIPRPAQRASSITSCSQGTQSVESIALAEPSHLLVEAEGMKSFKALLLQPSVSDVKALPSAVSESQFCLSEGQKHLVQVVEKAFVSRPTLSASGQNTSKRSSSKRKSLASRLNSKFRWTTTALTRTRRSRRLRKSAIVDSDYDADALDELSLDPDDILTLFSVPISVGSKPIRCSRMKCEGTDTGATAPDRMGDPGKKCSQDSLLEESAEDLSRATQKSPVRPENINLATKNPVDLEQLPEVQGDSSGKAPANSRTYEPPGIVNHDHSPILADPADETFLHYDISRDTISTEAKKTDAIVPESRSKHHTRSVSPISSHPYTSRVLRSRGLRRNCTLVSGKDIVRSTLAQKALSTCSKKARMGLCQSTAVLSPDTTITQDNNSLDGLTGISNFNNGSPHTVDTKVAAVSDQHAVNNNSMARYQSPKSKPSSSIGLATPAKRQHERTNTPLLDVLTPLSNSNSLLSHHRDVDAKSAGVDNSTTKTTKCGRGGFKCGKTFCFKCLAARMSS